MEMYLTFTLDYDGQCENIDNLELNGVNKIDDVFYDDINEYVKKLKELNGNIIPEK